MSFLFRLGKEVNDLVGKDLMFAVGLRPIKLMILDVLGICIFVGKDLMFAVGFFDWGLGNADWGLGNANGGRRVFDKSRNAAFDCGLGNADWGF